MFTHNTPWTDIYGITHAAAVFAVKYASLSEQANQDKQLQEDGTYQTNNNGSKYMNYRMVYWISQEAKDDGVKPLTYQDATGNWDLHVQLTETPADLIAACESHFQTTVLA